MVPVKNHFHCPMKRRQLYSLLDVRITVSKESDAQNHHMTSLNV